ncbi:hypothetical protein F4692_000648 [Nocardioides cavernae]|uniref:Uncharacterized protein n=1 Tax=Nocardioides cavernae TaxID=1921566 RepID=A0A7Y9H1U1_9ACTN|nr:hypothetical protein [Nocardioides cavernae]NYE35544.1 hypothetical protein [Nocardioides cavernae]
MDDEEYARELFRILTRPPEPDLEPGRLGDDWIDRSDGFRTDVQVVSLEVVPGPYGAQVDVRFELDVPAGYDVPAQGHVLMPLDEEWRAASGFVEPEDYAPRIAGRVSRAAREHVVAHTGPPRRGFDVPDREEQHALLLRVLGRHGEVEHVASDCYVVRTDGDDDMVVLLTPEQ